MTNEEVLSRIHGHLIVSCQALDNEPLHSSFIMGRMAKAALEGGASGIRANTVEDVTEIKKIVPLPVIGIHKVDYPDSEVYITPTMKEIDEMSGCGCEIVALDATDRAHPGGRSIDDLFQEARKKYPDQLFMADCSTYEECLHAQAIGFDIAGTTMRSYTPYTKGVKIPDFELFKALKRDLRIPFIAEGGISTPEELRQAMDSGAWACVVGGAITRPQQITRRFVSALA